MPEGGRLLDAGAFLGTFGLGVMRKKRTAFACFVEGNADLIAALEENLDRNARCPFYICHSVLAGERGIQIAGSMEEGNLGSMSFAPSVSAGSVGTRLPELRDKFGDFDLVKLDIEGLEADVLRCDIEWVANGGAAFLIECNERPASLELGALLLSTKVPLYYFAFPSFNPRNFRGNSIPIFDFAYEADLVLSPHGEPKLDRHLARNDCILRPIHSVAELKRALWETPRFGLSTWRGAKNAVEAALAGREYLSHDFVSFLTEPEQKIATDHA